MSRHVRRLSLLPLALLAGVLLAAAVPAIAPSDAAAPPSTASFTAVDDAWQVSGDAASSSVTIAMGGTVTFGYPTGRTTHNADFGTGPAPSSCAQTAGTPGGTPPPLPTSPTAAGWSGTCTFDAPGTYTFHCDLHTFMHGTITVVDPNAPPPPTTTGGGTTGTTPTTGTTGTTGTTTAPSGGGGGSTTGSTTPGGTSSTGGTPLPAPGALHARVSVAHLQRGTVVRGAVANVAAGTRIDVAALVSSAALATRRAHHARQVRVGTRHLRASRAGTARFAVTLDAAARAALRRRHSLAVALRVVVTPPGGRALARTIHVTLRQRRVAPPPSVPGY